MEDRQFAATPQGRQMRTVRESVEIDALRVQVFTSSDFDNLVFGLNSTLPLGHPMGPGWAALTALGFIMGAIPGASLRFAPGHHRTAPSALKARQPASQSSKIRTIRVLFAKFASRLPAFPLFAFSRILALQPSAFSLQPYFKCHHDIKNDGNGRGDILPVQKLC